MKYLKISSADWKGLFGSLSTASFSLQGSTTNRVVSVFGEFPGCHIILLTADNNIFDSEFGYWNDSSVPTFLPEKLVYLKENCEELTLGTSDTNVTELIDEKNNITYKAFFNRVPKDDRKLLCSDGCNYLLFKNMSSETMCSVISDILKDYACNPKEIVDGFFSKDSAIIVNNNFVEIFHGPFLVRKLKLLKDEDIEKDSFTKEYVSRLNSVTDLEGFFKQLLSIDYINTEDTKCLLKYEIFEKVLHKLNSGVEYFLLSGRWSIDYPRVAELTEELSKSLGVKVVSAPFGCTNQDKLIIDHIFEKYLLDHEWKQPKISKIDYIRARQSTVSYLVDQIKWILHKINYTTDIVDWIFPQKKVISGKFYRNFFEFEDSPLEIEENGLIVKNIFARSIDSSRGFEIRRYLLYDKTILARMSRSGCEKLFDLNKLIESLDEIINNEPLFKELNQLWFYDDMVMLSKYLSGEKKLSAAEKTYSISKLVELVGGINRENLLKFSLFRKIREDLLEENSTAFNSRFDYNPSWDYFSDKNPVIKDIGEYNGRIILPQKLTKLKVDIECFSSVNFRNNVREFIPVGVKLVSLTDQ